MWVEGEEGARLGAVVGGLLPRPNFPKQTNSLEQAHPPASSALQYANVRHEKNLPAPVVPDHSPSSHLTFERRPSPLNALTAGQPRPTVRLCQSSYLARRWASLHTCKFHRSVGSWSPMFPMVALCVTTPTVPLQCKSDLAVRQTGPPQTCKAPVKQATLFPVLSRCAARNQILPNPG